MLETTPAAGIRVRQTAPEYQGTDVYHSLYLPVDWTPGGNHPILVEYTGNRFPPGKGSGEVKDASLGYGISGGRQFIWIVMPYIESDLRRNTVNWWGDRQATIDYCKTNLPRICRQFGGDSDNVIFCGFSRGALGVSYIGLADDEIASMWKAGVTHDHFDGQRTWNYPYSDRSSALKRLHRLEGRPMLVCGSGNEYLKGHPRLAAFTFMPVAVAQIYNIPEGPVLHSHTDRWMHRDSPQRQQLRRWVQQVVDE